MNLTILAAADTDWGIGIDGRLPWHLPEDLKRFRERTMGKTVVMGRRTVATLPSKLPGRRIVTLTRTPIGFDAYDLGGLLAHLANLGKEAIVAGGGEVYGAMLPYCTKAEITRVHGTHACDTRMIDLGEHGWTLVGSRPLSENSNIEEWRPL